MKKNLLLLFLSLIIGTLNAQNPQGNWSGNLKVQTIQLPLVFHVQESAGQFSSTMDSPAQHATGIVVDQTILSGDSIEFQLSSLGINYKGKIDTDTITGIFTQRGQHFPLQLVRTNRPKSLSPHKRPQDPQSFPYPTEEVSFYNSKAGIHLSGTLSLPAHGEVKKVVVLISGSGPQNRDEEIAQFNHRPFLVWSDWLCRHGIGVLRYDDRGVAKSEGNFSEATSADFADDAEAALHYLQSRNDLKGAEIGLLGHSEGGMIAPMVAARNKTVSFLVLLAAPGIPNDSLLLEQSAAISRLNHMPAQLQQLNQQTMQAIYSYLNNHKTLESDHSEQDRIAIEELLTKFLQNYPKDALQGRSVESIVTGQSGQLLTKWFRYFISYDPAQNLEKVSCPVLALNGTLDCQVIAASNLKGIKDALTKGHNPDFEIVTLQGLNHLFQKAASGAISEYSQIEETVDPLALNKVSNWINLLN